MTETLRILIVDDEAPARERLSRLVDDLPGYEVAGVGATGREAVELVGTTHPDIVLLDIRMPDMDGIEAARHLSQLDPAPAVIFTTAYDQYALDAFESEAIGYLLKPVRQRRLSKALDRAARLTAQQLAGMKSEEAPDRKHISARVGDSLRLVPIDEILFFRADQKYVTVYHVGGEEIIDESLKSLADELAPRFIRTHRSLLVAVSAMDRLERDGEGRYWVRLRGLDEALPVSRRQVADVKRHITYR